MKGQSVLSDAQKARRGFVPPDLLFEGYTLSTESFLAPVVG